MIRRLKLEGRSIKREGMANWEVSLRENGGIYVNNLLVVEGIKIVKIVVPLIDDNETTIVPLKGYEYMAIGFIYVKEEGNIDKMSINLFYIEDKSTLDKWESVTGNLTDEQFNRLNDINIGVPMIAYEETVGKKGTYVGDGRDWDVVTPFKIPSSKLTLTALEHETRERIFVRAK